MYVTESRYYHNTVLSYGYYKPQVTYSSNLAFLFAYLRLRLISVTLMRHYELTGRTEFTITKKRVAITYYYFMFNDGIRWVMNLLFQIVQRRIVSDCINVSFHISRGWLLNPMINVCSSCLWRTSEYIYTQYRFSYYDCEVDDCLSRFMLGRLCNRSMPIIVTTVMPSSC